MRLQTAEVNAAKRLLRAEGLTATGRVGSARAWSRLIAGVPSDFSSLRFLELHRAVWLEAQRHIEELERHLEELARGHGKAFRHLQTLAGVGPIVALTAISAFSDVKRFPSAKQAASYAGLVPRTYHSGEREAFGSITKSGSPELRAMLVQAAHAAHRPDHPMHAHLRSVALRAGMRKAIVAVAHRMCRVIYAMLRDGRDFDASRVTPPHTSAAAHKLYVMKPAQAFRKSVTN